jgi:hypothetical protein
MLTLDELIAERDELEARSKRRLNFFVSPPGVTVGASPLDVRFTREDKIRLVELNSLIAARMTR